MRIKEKTDFVHIGLATTMIAASLALLLFINQCGLGFTYDSHLYLRIAEQIGTHGFFLAEGFNHKPPLYPLLIYKIGVGNISALNLICLLITLGLLYRFGLTIKAKTLRWAFWTISLFATPLYLVHAFAWTEPPFITVLLMVFYLIHLYHQYDKPILLYTSIVLLFLLPFIRFAGIFILIPTLVTLFLKLPTREKKTIAILACIGTMISAIWVWHFDQGFLRRWYTFIMPLVKANSSPYMYNINSYLEALSIWILPIPVYRPLRLLLASITLMCIGIASVKRFWKSSNDICLNIPFIFLCYYIALHFVFGVEYYSAERYLTPLYHLLLLSLFVWLDQHFATLKAFSRKGVWICLSMLLVYNIARTTKNVLFWNQLRCASNIQSYRDLPLR